MADAYKPRLRKLYEDSIVKAMTEKFGYKNAMEVPKIEKITLNMGVGEATQDKKKVESAAAEMELIAGQKPVVTKAKKSIAQFKLREGMPIGCKVTLRRERMYEFLDRLITIAMPRIRDFRGVFRTTSLASCSRVAEAPYSVALYWYLISAIFVPLAYRTVFLYSYFAGSV